MQPATSRNFHKKDLFLCTDTWTERWQTSTWKVAEDLAGKFEHSAGDWYGHPEEDKGIRTTPDARFYTIWTEMEEEFTNKGKDLVLQVC